MILECSFPSMTDSYILSFIFILMCQIEDVWWTIFFSFQADTAGKDLATARWGSLSMWWRYAKANDSPLLRDELSVMSWGVDVDLQ